jgi:glycosyltransferase involved in cell wall biosynthesis
MKASIIIAFYKKIHYLELVLAGFERQTEKDFEIIVADDGSGTEVHKEITRIIRNSSLNIRHIWHEDKGWRKNIMLNMATRMAVSDYLIFIDGDCIPHRNFVREHLRNRKKGKILSGRRLNLSEKISGQLMVEKVKDGFLEKNIFTWLIKGLLGEISHAEKGLFLPWLRPVLMLKKKHLMGANFSIFRDDLYTINGFDERYLAPTIGEDTDIEYRAGLAGIGIRSVRNLAVQYHLYHNLLSRKNNNYLIFEETRRNKISFTPYGLLQEKQNRS